MIAFSVRHSHRMPAGPYHAVHSSLFAAHTDSLRKTAGLQLLLDLRRVFLHFICANPFNYATGDRLSVLLRQRVSEKFLNPNQITSRSTFAFTASSLSISSWIYVGFFSLFAYFSVPFVRKHWHFLFVFVCQPKEKYFHFLCADICCSAP